MILEELRIKTRHYHEKIEQTLNLFNTGMTLSQYKILLEGFYGFYKPLEANLDKILEQESLLPDYSIRKKQPLLKQDLIALGVSSAELEQLKTCDRLPPLNNTAQAMGCLYVIEGSTLGGQVIAKYLKNLMNLDDNNGCRFFIGYGERTGFMWQEFRTALTDFATDYPDGKESIIITACQTFIALDDWFTHKMQFRKAV
jgi:heme oxygenase (biliverdin-IX-beta and delta-forming)